MSRIFEALLVLLIGVSLAGAFPLTGGNDLGNVTVAGVLCSAGGENEKIVMVDTILKNLSPAFESVALVDDEDNFYYRDGLSEEIGLVTTANIDNREFFRFVVPTEAIIKKLAFQPLSGDPIVILWDTIPKIETTAATVEILGVTEQIHPKVSIIKAMLYDVRITNTGNETMTLGGFGLVDTLGWSYEAGIREQDTYVKLLPGDSIKTLIGSNQISTLSEIASFNWFPDNGSVENVSVIGFN
jgi:hypothetical protein